ncbi:MAG TPA: NAD(P)-dependent alcohol dehydrogenase [Streptosporangiaceae bacterium]|nr:NAD(P)-dependent alcohol dehydrogenase [Streptosporangiaceae bacterium]
MNTSTMTTTQRTTDGTTMQAITQDRYGEAGDVLRLEEIARPAIGDEDVLLRVHAAGVDQGVWHLMTGLPYPVRLACGIRAPKTRVRGREVAGRVEATGSAVTALRVGDEVFGIADGSFAQYASARPGKLAPKPANLTFAQAAAVPVSALTALQAVRDRGRVQAGQKVLVIGASGGVGTFAVQIAKAAGAEVTGVSSTAKLDLVRSLGADHVIDYTRDDITAGDHRYDVILDTGGHRPLSQLRRALTPRGTLVIVGSEHGGRWLGGSDRQLRALMLSPFTSQRLTTLICSENTQDLQALTELIESGQVRPVIDRTYPLSQIPQAIQYLRDGHAQGKVVVNL